MAKPVRVPEKSQRNRVWRPSDYEGIEIGIKRSNALKFPQHYMRDYTIVLNGKGEGEANYGAQHYTFTDIHQLVFLQNPGKVFSGQFGGEEGATGACLVISRSLFSQLRNMLDIESDAFFSRMLLPESINTFVARLTAESIRTFATPASKLERDTKLLSLIEAVLDYGSDVSLPEPSLGREHRAVSLVTDVLQANPGDDHSISSLSSIAGLNQKYLIDVFTRDVGLPPHRYLTSIRIDRAKDQLVRGEAMQRVAQDLGFYDQSHFSRTFKRYVRVTPSQFKRDSIATI